MKRKKPLPQRWPGQWVFRGRIWSPDKGSLEYEGLLEDPLGPFIQILMIIAFTRETFLTPKMKSILKEALAKIGVEMAKASKKKKK